MLALHCAAFSSTLQETVKTSLLGPFHLEMALIVEANEQISSYLYFIEII